MLRGRRGPILVGAAFAALLVLMAVVLVLPKMSEVSSARGDLTTAEGEERTLQSQLAALGEAELLAPEAKADIEEVERQIPPTADEPGLLLLLKNAAVGSSVTGITFTVGTPVADPLTGLTTIPVTVSGSGTYFSLTEFLYSLETLPRATKTSDVSIAPGGGTTDATTGITTSTLTMQANVVFFTTDASAGPGSDPGPSEAAVDTAESPTTPPAEG